MNDIEQIIHDPVYFAEHYITLNDHLTSLGSEQKSLFRHLRHPNKYYFEREAGWGKTYVLAIYALWRLTTDSHKQIGFFVHNRLAIKNIHGLVSKMFLSLPRYLRCSITGYTADHLKWENKSAINFSTVGLGAVRGRSFTDIIVDSFDACEHDDRQDLLAAYRPCLGLNTDYSFILSSRPTTNKMNITCESLRQV